MFSLTRKPRISRWSQNIKMNNQEINKGGRPVKQLGSCKNYFVKIRLDTQQYYNLKGLAKQSGMNVSEFIRTMVFNGFVKERISKEQMAIIRHLTGMANNLNQLAQSANTYGYTAVEMQNAEIAEEITSIIKTLGDDR